MKVKICVVILYLITSNFLKGQNKKGELTGWISDGKNSLELALVVIEKTNFGVHSNSDGFFRIKLIPSGSYQISISLIGYKTFKKKIQIEADSITKLEIKLEPDDEMPEEVIVSGTLRESYTSASPIKVEIYTPTLFKKNPTSNIFEALQMVNGVQPQLNCNICNTGDIHINGMEGPYTMVTIDGMPIVSSLSTVYGLSGIPNSLIKRVEIVKGPASTLYGSEAVGGLINIITKDPAGASRTSLDIFATSQQEYNVDLSAKTKIAKAHLLTGVNYYNFNNKLDINKDNFTDVTLQNRISIFNKINFDRKEGRIASIAARYFYEDRWGGALDWTKKFRGGNEIYGESIFTNRLELLGVYQLPTRENIRLQYSFNTHFQNSVYGTTLYIANQKIAFAQALWEKKLGSRNNLLVGLPIRYTYYDDNTPATNSQDSLSNQPQKIILPGIFLQNEFSATEHLSLLSGIRLDHNSKHGNIFSPRLSLKYDFNKKHIVRWSGGNGYRVVNLFTEDHAALTGARSVVIKEDLRPEQSWNTNINYQSFINHKAGFINLDFSLFYTYFSNKIIGDFISDPNKIIYQNLQEYAVSRGITINTDFNFKNGIKAVLGTTLMEVYSVDNKQKIPQLHAPRISGTYALSYTTTNSGWSIDITGRINGPMHLPVFPNDFRPSLSPWYGIHNLQITKKTSKGLEFYGGIKNILNFLPKYVLLHSDDPFDVAGGKYFLADGSPNPNSNPNGFSFDAAYNYAPIQGIRGFFGIRWSIN